MFHVIIYLGVWQTANLDGETNLKIRKALERTWDYLTPEKAAEFKGYLRFRYYFKIYIHVQIYVHMCARMFRYFESE